jgi:biotin-dependent carboxylase-like uncharacterized protein
VHEVEIVQEFSVTATLLAMGLIVEKAGVYDLLVDSGRPGWRHLGISQSGPADRTSWALANALVGNENACALEVTLAGPVLRATSELYCAFYGAPFPLRIDGREVSPGTVWLLRPDQVLEIGPARAGVRGYLAVAGGLLVSERLGSRSGFQPLQRGQVLPCESRRVKRRRWLEPVPHACVWNETLVRLRVLPGPFWPEVGATILAKTWTVGRQSNRMGVRLHAEVGWELPHDLPSQPVCPGTVQATVAGELLVLGVDGQTIGGYPRVAHVIQADWDLLGQLRPGQQVRFEAVQMEEARRLAIELGNWRRQAVHRLLLTA